MYGLNGITGSGDPMDDNSHGTHCAGTIGGVGGNGIGVVGVSPTVSIMACKFLDADGSGSISAAMRCLEYALDMGATLTSNSWGGGNASPAFSALLDIAQQRGQLFVPAAGNSGTNNDVIPQYPSNYEQDPLLSRWPPPRLPTRGAASAATVRHLLISELLEATSGRPFPTTDTLLTPALRSMATPHVAGGFALLYAIKPSITADEIKRVIMATGEPINDLQRRTVSGRRMDVKAALDCLSDTDCDLLSETPAPTEAPPPPPPPCRPCLLARLFCCY